MQGHGDRRITIARDRVETALRDDPHQATCPVDTSRVGVRIAAQMIVKTLTDPPSPAQGPSSA